MSEDFSKLLTQSRRALRKARRDTPKPKTAPSKSVILHQVDDRSSIIVALGFNKETKTLGVAFKNKYIYLYPNRTLAEYKRLLKAESIGSAFSALKLTKYERIQ